MVQVYEVAEQPLPYKEGKNYRLPTEAEWVYRSRVRSKGRWSFGDNEVELLKCARFYSNSQGHPWPVAGLEQNAWGLHDMHGNVWEWCQDVYDANCYMASPPKDPPAPGAGGERVQLGGAWCFHPGQCRSAFRVRNTPGARCDDDGILGALRQGGVQVSGLAWQDRFSGTETGGVSPLAPHWSRNDDTASWQAADARTSARGPERQLRRATDAALRSHDRADLRRLRIRSDYVHLHAKW